MTSILLALAASSALAAGSGPEIKLLDAKRFTIPRAAERADAEGLRHLNDGSYDEAVRSFDKSLKLARRNPRARANRGLALSQLGRLDDALKDFDAALALAPELKTPLKAPIVDARVRRGRGRLGSGDPKRALEDLFWAVRVDRADPRGFAAVAHVARRTGRHETCVRYASRALELGGDPAETLTERSSCLAALGRREEAYKDIGRAVALEPGRADLFLARAELAWDLRRRAAAKRDVKRALELDPSLSNKLPAALR